MSLSDPKNSTLLTIIISGASVTLVSLVVHVAKDKYVSKLLAELAPRAGTTTLSVLGTGTGAPVELTSCTPHENGKLVFVTLTVVFTTVVHGHITPSTVTL